MKLILALQKHVLLFIVLIHINTIVLGQKTPKRNIETLAIKDFERKNYKEASEGFEQLISIYPKEPAYNYYLGVSYLKLNYNLDKSLEYIRYSASQNYKVDAHFYLFMTYYKSYMFKDAQISLTNFKNLAKNKDKKKANLKYWQLALNKAKNSTQSVEKLSVTSSKLCEMMEIGDVYKKHLNEDFMPKPIELETKYDKKENYKGFSFYPNKRESGQIIIVPARTRRNSTDLFFTQRTTSNSFSEIEPIKNLNTHYSEEYPYYDHQTKELYFSSNRPGGFGGYDIYKSVYNETTGKFEEPIHLKFPINSPYDDMLFVPNLVSGFVMFLSNRDATSGHFIAYKYKLNKKPKLISIETANEIAEIASLGISADAPPKAVLEHNEISKKTNSEYDQLLINALKIQLKCDSLQSFVITAKNKFRSEPNIDKKNTLKLQVKAIEQESEKLQQEADLLFLAAREIREESKLNSHKRVELYTNKAVSNSVNNNNDIIENSYENGKELSTEKMEFEIFSKCPYSLEQPIPIDEVLTDELFYKIQLGAYSKNLPLDWFGGLYPLSAESIEGKELIRYFIGKFYSAKDARKALDEIKQIGYKDAFIVSFYQKKKISIQKAQELEFGRKF